MQTSFWNIQIGDSIPPAALCDQIEQECHYELLSICSDIEHYFEQQEEMHFSDSIAEIVQLVFLKMEDEMKHLFLKEKNLIFPVIKSRKPLFVLAPAVWTYIVHTQRGIADLLQKIRHLLNHFQVLPNWSKGGGIVFSSFFSWRKKFISGFLLSRIFFIHPVFNQCVSIKLTWKRSN
jgi:hypothetical protein